MMHAPHRVRRRSGFSLVEMMVVLLIMASLATVASVSVGTTQDKARADKTAAIGREVVEALERSEGLSFVSDFGRLPQNADELKFLFSQKVTYAGPSFHTASAYQIRTLELPGSPTPGLPAGSDYSKFKEAFGTTESNTAPTLGVGWRGPYSITAALSGEVGEVSEFLDGWNNEWDVLLDGGSFSGLRSLGRGGQTGGDGWQENDLELPLRRNPESVDFRGEVIVRGADNAVYENQANFTDITLKVIYFTPDFPSASNFALNATTENVALVEFTWQKSTGDWTETPTRPEEASENPFAFRLSELSAGQRTVFVYAVGAPIGKPQAHYAGGAKLVDIKPGANKVEFNLYEIN